MSGGPFRRVRWTVGEQDIYARGRGLSQTGACGETVSDIDDELPWQGTKELPNGWTLRWLEDNGWFVGQVVEMPSAISQGRTMVELIWMIQDAIAVLQEADEE